MSLTSGEDISHHLEAVCTEAEAAGPGCQTRVEPLDPLDRPSELRHLRRGSLGVPDPDSHQEGKRLFQPSSSFDFKTPLLAYL